MDNREALIQAFEEFNAKPVEKIPDVLERYFQRVAVTGETLFEWEKLKLAFRSKMDLAMKMFHEEVPTDHFLPTPNVENVKFDEMRTRLINVLDTFTGAPFTIQRLCELVTNPHKHYMRTDKFLRGIEKNLMIVSAVDPFGNKIVSEGKSRPYINGLDANGVENNECTPEKKDSPFFPPPPVNSPAASSWFSNLTPTNSPINMRSPWQRSGAGDASSTSAAMLQSAFTEETWTENELDEFGHGPPEKKSRLSVQKPTAGMMDANQSSDGYFGAGNNDQKHGRSGFDAAVSGQNIGRNMFEHQLGSSKYRITGSDVEVQYSEAGISGSDSSSHVLKDDGVSSGAEVTGVSSAMDTETSDDKQSSDEPSQSVICSSMSSATSSSEPLQVSQSVVVSSELTHVTDSPSSSSSSSTPEPDSDSTRSIVHSSQSELSNTGPTSSSPAGQAPQAEPSDSSAVSPLESKSGSINSLSTLSEGNEATSVCNNTESANLNQVSTDAEPSSVVDSSGSEPSAQLQDPVDQSGQSSLDDSPSDDLRDSRDSQGFDVSPDLDEDQCETSQSQCQDDLQTSRCQQEVSSSSESKPTARNSSDREAETAQSTVSSEESSSSSNSSSEVHSQSPETSITSPKHLAESLSESAEAVAEHSESAESLSVVVSESPKLQSSDNMPDNHVSSQPTPAASDHKSPQVSASVSDPSDAVSADADAQPTSASCSQEDIESGRQSSTEASVKQTEPLSVEAEPTSTVQPANTGDSSSSDSTSSLEQHDHEPMDIN